MSNEKIHVGMKLYKDIKSEPVEVIVSKVGKKYFEIKDNSRHRFNNQTLQYENKEYSQHNYTLYRTSQEIVDRHEKSKLWDRTAAHFRAYTPNLTIEQLRQIDKIINP